MNASLFTSVCPDVTQPVSLSRRFLDASAGDACSAGGVVGIRDNITDTIFCTGVLTSPDTLVVPLDCADYFDQVLAVPDLAHVVNVGGGQQEIYITKDNYAFVDTGDGNAEITLPEQVSVTNCPEYACVYDSATMSGKVNFDDCFSLSYGTQSNSDHSYTGTVSAMVVFNITTDTCCDVLMESVNSQPDGTYPGTVVNINSNTVCMGTTDSTCGGDFGSPVYCRSFDTNEVILVAVMTSAPCDAGTPLLANDLTNGDMAAYFS